MILYQAVTTILDEGNLKKGDTKFLFISALPKWWFLFLEGEATVAVLDGTEKKTVQ